MQKIYVSQFRCLALTLSLPVEELRNGKIEVVKEGKTVRFNGGQYVAKNEEEINALEKSPRFGCDFFDLDAQRNKAIEAQKKVKSSLVAVLEGARKSNQQVIDRSLELRADNKVEWKEDTIVPNPLAGAAPVKKEDEAKVSQPEVVEKKTAKRGRPKGKTKK